MWVSIDFNFTHSLCKLSICIFLLPESKHTFIDQKKDILHRTVLARVFLHFWGLTLQSSNRHLLSHCYLSAFVLDTTVSKQTWSLLRKVRYHLGLKNKQTKTRYEKWFEHRWINFLVLMVRISKQVGGKSNLNQFSSGSNIWPNMSVDYLRCVVWFVNFQRTPLCK